MQDMVTTNKCAGPSQHALVCDLERRTGVVTEANVNREERKRA